MTAQYLLRRPVFGYPRPRRLMPDTQGSAHSGGCVQPVARRVRIVSRYCLIASASTHVIFPLAVVDFSCVVLAPATPISPVVDPFSSVHIAVCKLELALRKPCRCVRKFRNNSRRSNWRGKRSAGESVDVQILPSGPAATFQNRRLLQDTRMCLCPRAGRASIHPRTEAAR